METFTSRHIAELSAIVASDRFSTGQSNRELHRHDISFHEGSLPAGIIWPLSTDEVSRILSPAMFRLRPGRPAPAPRAIPCPPEADSWWI